VVILLWVADPHVPPLNIVSRTLVPVFSPRVIIGSRSGEFTRIQGEATFDGRPYSTLSLTYDLLSRIR
jgi:hypothetical protein